MNSGIKFSLDLFDFDIMEACAKAVSTVCSAKPILNLPSKDRIMNFVSTPLQATRSELILSIFFCCELVPVMFATCFRVLKTFATVSGFGTKSVFCLILFA